MESHQAADQTTVFAHEQQFPPLMTKSQSKFIMLTTLPAYEGQPLQTDPAVESLWVEKSLCSKEAKHSMSKTVLEIAHQPPKKMIYLAS